MTRRVTPDLEIIFYLHCFKFDFNLVYIFMLVLAITIVYMHDITPSTLVILKNY
jgi:hypothetical protein